MPNRRSARHLRESEFEALTPPRLDAFRKMLLSLEESAEMSDVGASQAEALDPSLIHFKDDPRWAEQMKSVLDRLR